MSPSLWHALASLLFAFAFAFALWSLADSVVKWIRAYRSVRRELRKLKELDQ